MLIDGMEGAIMDAEAYTNLASVNIEAVNKSQQRGSG
jgi:hypothetical protein